MKDVILKYLMDADRPVKRKELLKYLRNVYDFNTTDRAQRLAIEELIVMDGYCIASSEKGYQLIKSREQLDAAKKYLDAKAEAIAIRKNCLERNFNRTVKTGQADLFNELTPI